VMPEILLPRLEIGKVFSYTIFSVYSNFKYGAENDD